MGRRLRRFRHIAQQVVTVTRRIFRLCRCCGHVEFDTQKDLVPVASVITGNIAVKVRSDNHQCPHHDVEPAFMERLERPDERDDAQEVYQTPQAAEEAMRNGTRESKTKVLLPIAAASKHRVCSQITACGNSVHNGNLTGSDSFTTRMQIPKREIPDFPRTSPDNEASGCKSLGLRRSEIFPSLPTITNSPSSLEFFDEHRLERSVGLTELTTLIGPSGSDQENSSCGRSTAETSGIFPEPSSASRCSCHSTTSNADMRGEMSILSSSPERPHLVRQPTMFTYRNDPVPEFQGFQFSAGPSTKDVYASRASKISQELVLNLSLSDAASVQRTSSTDLNVEFAITEVWHTIHPIEWTVQKTLARGKFATVQLVMLGEHNKQICLKTTEAGRSQREAELLIECQGQFVVKLCAVLVEAEERHICMYFYEMGDLWHWMRQDNPRNVFGEPEAIWITAHLLTSIQYLHEKKIIHLDIKPANILIDDRGYPVLTDFGSAMRMRDASDYTGGIAVTPAYSSPEMIECRSPDRLADLWGTVSIFYEIIKGNPPCLGKSVAETEMKITLGITPNVSQLSPLAQDFVISQLQPLRDRRLGYTTGASAVMKHRIFRNIDWDIVKYGSRYENSPILGLLKKLKKDEEESPFQVETPNFGRNNNKWELWSSSSSDSTEEEFEISSRRKFKKLPTLTEDDRSTTANSLETDGLIEDIGRDDVEYGADHVT